MVVSYHGEYGARQREESVFVYHTKSTLSKILAGTPDRVHPRQAAAGPLNIEGKYRNKRRGLGEIRTVERRQGIHLVADEVDIALLAKPQAHLQLRSRIALPKRIVRIR